MLVLYDATWEDGLRRGLHRGSPSWMNGNGNGSLSPQNDEYKQTFRFQRRARQITILHAGFLCKS